REQSFGECVAGVERGWRDKTGPGGVDPLAYQRIAVGVDSGRGEPEDDVPGCNILPWQQAIAFRRSDRKPGEGIVTVLVDPRHLGGLAADQGASGLPTALRDAGNDRRPNLGV